MTDREVMQQALEALREFGYHGSSPRWERTADALKATLEQPEQRKTLTAIRLLTDQCAALIRERDKLQKQVWRYEKNGITCQTYRHKVEQSCSECNVQENYTAPPQRKPLSEKEAHALIMEDYLMEDEFASAMELIRRVEQAHGIKETP